MLSIKSENDVFVNLIQEILGLRVLPVSSLLMVFNVVLFLSVLFLVVQNLLQSEEIFSCLLVQLLIDVLVNCDESWDDDML